MTSQAERRIWDISQRLRPAIPVWPGDTAFTRHRTWLMEDASPVNVSSLTMSTHTGSHADAPLHYSKSAADIASVDLRVYLGDCLVVDARKAGALIKPSDLPSLEGVRRVLFRSFACFPHDHWETEFTAIAPEAIEHLARQGVLLVGIDSPSIDPQDSKEMLAHRMVLKHDLRILEGLVLDDVRPGRYELIALPLPIAEADASPVRAVLREIV